MPLSRDNVEDWFKYHAPGAVQTEKFARIRAACTAAAIVVLENAPMCGDTVAAVRKIKEAQMSANSAIATKGIV